VVESRMRRGCDAFSGILVQETTAWSTTYLEALGPLWDDKRQVGLDPGPGLRNGRTLGRELRRLYKAEKECEAGLSMVS
jgi:hypothetical protein